MAKDVPQGYYLDTEGNLCKDRRKRKERRTDVSGDYDGERRRNSRRRADRERIEAEHHHWIEEALEEFAETHPRTNP